VTPENSLADRDVLAELDAVFASFLKRNKKVWVLTVMMTVSSFALIFAMITLAVVLAVVKDKASWSLIFGSASVPLIIGTLIWRPFDRMFRATILTHQLEMIHVQVVTAFRATHDPEERRKICREGFDELALVFDKHSEPEERRQRAKPGPRSGRRQEGVRESRVSRVRESGSP
jgi:hypothetical protein